MVWSSIQQVGLLAALALPLLAVLAGRLLRSTSVQVGLSWMGAGSALVVVVLVAAWGPAAVSAGAGPVMVAQPVPAVLLLLVAGVGALVQSYSARYLQADSSSDRFSGWVGIVVAAMGLVAVSADLAGLVGGWVVAGVAFTAAMRHRSDLPGVPAGVSAARRAIAVGDGCLIAAAAVIWWKVGDVQLGSPHYLSAAAGRLGAWQAVVTVLVVVAALARCGQAPFRRWLPLTVSAPTPTCALLHAGVINGGGVLLVRLGPLASWRPAMMILLAVAGSTAAWAGAVASRQADIKGQLAFSTMAQMGFMLAECAVGAYAAAVIHLVGHGLYKASLFLSSGSTVPVTGRPALPRRPGWPSETPVVAILVAAAVAVSGLLAGDDPVLLILAVVTAASLAVAFWTALPDGPWAGRQKWVAVLLAASGLYGTAVSYLAGFLAADVAITTPALGQWWLAALAATAAVIWQLAARGPWAPALRARLLDAGAAPAGSYGIARPGPASPPMAISEPSRVPALEVSAA